MLKFPLGQVVVTPTIERSVPEEVVLAFLNRHVSGDWGDIPAVDAEENELSLIKGFRVMSVYEFHGTKVWIITEADRSLTTVLLPEEY